MGPSLRDVGAGAADFYLRTGYMPLAHPDDQPSRTASSSTDARSARSSRYVASFGAGPPIPQPHPERGASPRACASSPSTARAATRSSRAGGVSRARACRRSTTRRRWRSPRRCAIGPYVMPRFTKETLSDAQLDSVIRYVEYAKHPPQTGGWSIGLLGPMPEGHGGVADRRAALVAVCIGDRQEAAHVRKLGDWLIARRRAAARARPPRRPRAAAAAPRIVAGRRADARGRARRGVAAPLRRGRAPPRFVASTGSTSAHLTQFLGLVARPRVRVRSPPRSS